MSTNLESSALARLLALNNQVHDLENQLKATSVPQMPVPRLHEFPGRLSATQRATVPHVFEVGPRLFDRDGEPTFAEDTAVNGAPSSNDIADMQERIDQGVRASLTTCWLGMSDDPES